MFLAISNVYIAPRDISTTRPLFSTVSGTAQMPANHRFLLNFIHRLFAGGFSYVNEDLNRGLRGDRSEILRGDPWNVVGSEITRQ